MGIRTGRVDALTFGLGSGIAGIAGVALSQIDNVSPNLGQAYIIDSFMVVVFGGVGNLWGTLVGRDDPRRRQQVPRALCRRRAGQDPGAGLHHPVHPEAPARPVRPQGPGGGALIDMITTAPAIPPPPCDPPHGGFMLGDAGSRRSSWCRCSTSRCREARACTCRPTW